VPGFSNGTVTEVVISPLLLALGAGLGRADAEPIFRVVTVPRELNPVPVIVTVSSIEAVLGEMVTTGFGAEKSVEDPVIAPTNISTI
jgi:hypothetical protein